METAKEDREILLSIIVPFYNEELNIQPLYQRLKNTLNDLTQSYELVFINDGSTDSTAEILESLFHDDPRISVIQLKGNYGQTPAL
jgi:glycosyltransferase involved in cell wall biosynthesis